MNNELISIFFEGRDSFAQARQTNGTVSYYPVEGQPTEADIEQHLRGTVVLGSYTLMRDSKVTYLSWDVDSLDLVKARTLAEAISEVLTDIPHGIEFSGNKGYHIWIFLTEPVAANKAKAFGLKVREQVGAPSSGDPHVEVFPKQDQLTTSSPMGNLLKLPLGLHPKTHNRSFFVDRKNGWESGPEVDPLGIMRNKVDFDVLEERLTGGTPVQKITNLLGGYWVQGERHNLALALSGFLATLGWSKDDVHELIDNLIDAHGGEPENLLECVETTYRRLTEGKTVQGFGALNETLPVSVMRSLCSLAGENIADPTIQLIDRIRVDKSPTFLKYRAAGETMYNHMADTGKFVKTANSLYWLDLGTHCLINMESPEWLSVIRKKFGINSKESFGVQTIEEVRLKAFSNATVSPVYKRFHWDGNTLHINFGGPEVYKLTGEKGKRSIVYNGSDNFLFLTSNNGLNDELGARNILEADPLNPWEFLTGDLSFEKNEHNAGTNEQQRQLLQAWILQLFFGSILNTRPIALFLGPRGSGKTTTARRILRFFEGFHEDVLGVVEDKQDSLRASLEEHLILALDNLEQTKAKWLDAFLNRLATGTQIEIRQLYKSNERYVIRPDVFVMLTGIELPTSEESLYSRILPLQLSPLRIPKSEFLIQSRLKDNLAGIWSGMFNYLDSAIQQLQINGTVIQPHSSRLADFTMFVNRIKNCSALNGESVMQGLDNLIVRQNVAMSAASPALQALDTWLVQCGKQRILTNPDMDCGEWRTTSDLFRILHTVARAERIDGFRWSSPAGFGRHWNILSEGGLENYVYQTRTIHNPRTGREEKQFRFPLLDLNADEAEETKTASS